MFGRHSVCLHQLANARAFASKVAERKSLVTLPEAKLMMDAASMHRLA